MTRKTLAPHRSSRMRDGAERSLVGFVVGDVAYAVEIASVREIVNPLPTTALPHLPPSVIGVANHRGEVIPIVDLRERFGLGKRIEGDRRVKWILVSAGEAIVGLVVDAMTSVFGVPSGDLRPAPELGGEGDLRGIASVAHHEGRFVFVLDLERFEALTAPLSGAALLAMKREEDAS